VESASASELAERYRGRRPALQRAADEIESLLHECLDDLPRVDGIRTRVKEVDRFLEKAGRINRDSGELRYQHPLDDIQDQIGARVVVVYKSDVQPIADRVLAEFCEVEDRVVEQADPASFGYEARHFVCIIPPDIVRQSGSAVHFFELQIATVFQHAWAEANHELGYKPQWELEYGAKRRIAWAAAQAWGADGIFEDLWLHAQAKEEGGT
jgi:putative GTP pyrophosphokinase